MDELDEAAHEASRRAAAILSEPRDLRKPLAEKSGPIDLVTAADHAAETAILGVLEARFPGHAVLAEESGRRDRSSNHRWIVDPLDGTTNFAHGYPQVAISIALEVDGEIVLGHVRDPLRNEVFHARKGRGATLNGADLRTSSTAGLATSLLATGFPYDRREHVDFYLAFVRAFLLRCHGIRRAGSAALDLCWVAAGRVDGFWEWSLQPWDTAAGALLVEEAGGRISAFDGGPFLLAGRQTLASNGLVHDEMIEILRSVGTRHPAE